MKFSSLKLRDRLILGFGIILFSISVVEVYTLFEFDKISKISNNLYRHPLKVSNTVRDIKININEMHGYVKDIVQSENSKEMEELTSLLNKRDQETHAKFDTVMKYFLGDRKDVESAHDSFEKWKVIRNEFIQLKIEGKTREALRIERGIGDIQIHEVLSKADEMIDYASNKANSFYGESLKVRELVLKRVIWLNIIIIILAVGVAVFITGSVTKPINKIIKKIKGISKDQFNFEISAAGGHSITILENTVDELEILSRKLADESQQRKMAQHELEDYQKHLEQIVTNRTKELEETKQLLSNAFDGAAIGMVLVETRGNFYWVNEAFCEIVGYTDSELKNLSFNDITHSEDQEIGTDIIQRILSGGVNSGYIFKRYIHKSGNVIYVKLTTSLIRDAAGKPLYFFTQVQDVTIQRIAEEQLKEYSTNLEKMVKERTLEIEKKSKSIQESQKALTFLLEDVNEYREELEITNAKLEIANKELEAFSYSVSHDLRAPLRAIDGFSRMVLENYSDALDEEGMRLFGIIRNNTKKMGTLIDDLLSFSRLGRKGMNQVKIDMNQLVKEISNEIIMQNPDRKIDLSYSDLPTALGDVILIRQVIFNLLSNAVKFTKMSNPSIIYIGFIEEGKQNIYYIQDNGVGFNMKYSDKLFNVFQRLHSDDEFEGTGVGLAIVQKIVSKHGGNVWAEAEQNKGAKFYFSLPNQNGG